MGGRGLVGRLVALAGIAALVVMGSPTTAASAAEVVPTEEWFSLGGIVTSDPAVVSLDDGTILHFARGQDGALWRYAEGDDGLGADRWVSLGGGIVGGPAAVASEEGVDVFARGLDDALWHRNLSDVGWSAWTRLGGVLRSDPAAWPTEDSDLGDGDVSVFVLGADRAQWQLRRTSGVWSGWFGLGGLPFNPSGSFGAAPGLVGATGTDGIVRTRSYSKLQGTWSSWMMLPLGRAVADPALMRAGTFYVYVVTGLDGALWTASFHSPPDTRLVWESHGGRLTSGPAATCLPKASEYEPDVFVVDGRGTDGALWSRTLTTTYPAGPCY